MVNIAIFVSGSGTNCENIIRYFQHHSSVRTSLVLSNRAEAFALVRAQRLGVPTVVVTRTQFNDRETMKDILASHDVNFIVLAGFLLMVPDFLINDFPHRMVNIHPSLLPKFGGKGMYGHHVHEAVRKSGDTETGITIHYVSTECDGGEIIFQARTTVASEDTPDDIAAKIHLLEQKHFPRVLEEVVQNMK